MMELKLKQAVIGPRVTTALTVLPAIVEIIPTISDVPNAGSTPKGGYAVGAPTVPGGGKRPIIPDPGTDTHGRDGFQTHGCRDPNTCSKGCIAATKNDTRDDFNNGMSSEEGHNHITVTR